MEGQSLHEAGGPQEGEIHKQQQPNTFGAKKELTAKSADARKYMRIGIVAVVAFALGWTTGHFGPGSAQDAGPNNTEPSPSDGAQTGATITANPNPVPLGPKGKGTTTISWNTGDGSEGLVFCSWNKEKEGLFAKGSSKGSKEAPWIGKDGIYDFRLYTGPYSKKKLVASVRVNPSKP
jgi:hypothetical protein